MNFASRRNEKASLAGSYVGGAAQSGEDPSKESLPDLGLQAGSNGLLVLTILLKDPSKLHIQIEIICQPRNLVIAL